MIESIKLSAEQVDGLAFILSRVSGAVELSQSPDGFLTVSTSSDRAYVAVDGSMA